ncbi:DUF3626 domain-containing protein [Shewanella sp. A25]|nr:DUF3626 domain-containing protein [Shewanella shenzhenensis]
MAPEGELTAAASGAAAAAGGRQPKQWREFGSQGEVMQLLKLLWHVLVRYGAAPA